MAKLSKKPGGSILHGLRLEFHRKLGTECVELRDGAPNMADSSSAASVRLAAGMVERMGLKPRANKVAIKGQTLGYLFTRHVFDFLQGAFAHFEHLRPGPWKFSASQGAGGISGYSQYSHIAELAALLESHPKLKSSLGSDYIITPDIVVARLPLTDEAINAREALLGNDAATAVYSPLRQNADGTRKPILHASISIKWSMRSDRAQNTRTEALNLIRNRKGGLPRIMAVTFEPTPARIASIAMGTGDIDCTYHAALPELMAAARALPAHESDVELLEMLVQGNRLRDISDLPLDLAI